MAQQDSMQFYEMIGAPLLAIVHAEFQAAQATAEYIERIGFEEEDPDAVAPEGVDNLGRLKMASFRQTRRRPDGGVEEWDVRIPKLSLAPIPMMQVKEADLDFSLKITDVESRMVSRTTLAHTSRTRGVDSDRGKMGGPPLSRENDFLSTNRVEFKTAMASMNSRAESGRRRASEMQMRVKMKIVPADIPTGIKHLLQLMDDSVDMKPVEPAANKAPTGGEESSMD